MTLLREMGRAAAAAGIVGALLTPASAFAEMDPHVTYKYSHNRIDAYEGGDHIGYVRMAGQYKMYIKDTRCDRFSPHGMVDSSKKEWWNSGGCKDPEKLHKVPHAYHFMLKFKGEKPSKWSHIH
ncbi:hypothetical protein [Nocardiopsis rhodophaea]|uniref:hypothetical protein n=1 Tax=Nocardiopsis rhodophaea TaxID=280238 RepID=UPI0031D94CC3